MWDKIADTLKKQLSPKDDKAYGISEALSQPLSHQKISIRGVSERVLAEDFSERKTQDSVFYLFDCIAIEYDPQYRSWLFEFQDYRFDDSESEEYWIKIMSRHIRGMSERLIRKALEQVGLAGFRKILNEKDGAALQRLGVKESGLPALWESWETLYYNRQFYSFAAEYGIGEKLAGRIYEHFRADSAKILSQSPYSLLEVQGIGFKIADNTALKWFKKHHPTKDKNEFYYRPERISAGVIYAAKEKSNETGNTLNAYGVVCRHAQKILGISLEEADKALRRAVNNGDFVSLFLEQYPDGWGLSERKGAQGVLEFISLREDYDLENLILEKLLAFYHCKGERRHFSQSRLRRFAQEHQGILSDEQIQACIHIGESNGIVNYTGGPGTGKTTTIGKFLQMCDMEGVSYILLAPVGKAAQKISESTGREAQTIHKFLQMTPDDDMTAPAKKRIDADIIFIDESSMLDLYSAYAVLNAVDPRRSTLVFIGDIDQLPPVGKGAFYQDCMDSHLATVCRLTQVYRVSENSTIHFNAQRLRNGEKMDLSPSDDLEFIPCANSDILENIRKTYTRIRKSGVHDMDMQILSPVKQNGMASCHHINRMIRAGKLKTLCQNQWFQHYFPYNDTQDESARIKVWERYLNEWGFLPKEKVIQNRNNYTLNVLNGDAGLCDDALAKNTGNLPVILGNPHFRTEKRGYEPKDIPDLSLAYCITIHKSQGSDYDVVIIPFDSSVFMWKMPAARNLLYTALTRTKKKVIIIGDKAVNDNLPPIDTSIKRLCNLSILCAAYRKRSSRYQENSSWTNN